MDCTLPGSSVHGILQTRILEWVAISSSRGSSRHRDQTQASWQGRRHWNSSGKVSPNKDYAVTLFFSPHKPTVWFFHDTDPMCTSFKVSVCVLSCPTLCDPVDCTLPGFSVHGIFQARTLVWVAIPFSRGASWPRNWTRISCISGISKWVLYRLCHLV